MNIETGTVYKFKRKTMYLWNCSSYKSFMYPGSPPLATISPEVGGNAFHLQFYRARQGLIMYWFIMALYKQIATELGSGDKASHLYFHCGVHTYSHWVHLDASWHCFFCLDTPSLNTQPSRLWANSCMVASKRSPQISKKSLGGWAPRTWIQCLGRNPQK